ncbi:hypothetical protein ACXR2U_00285 [Jatrophihabitans sp. YIM 134969]
MSFTQDAQPSRGRRRVLRTALIAVPALAVVAGASSVVTLAIAGDHSTATGAGHQASHSHSSSSKHHAATVGTLTAVDGSSWQVCTTSGKTLTVHLAPSTTFGSKADPSTESAFHDGSTVKVMGKDHHGTVDATRVVGVAAKDKSAPST